jgi:hypothetical protein
MPRLEASFTNAGSGAWMRTITGQAASCTIFSIRVRACWELSPSPTSATSGRSRAVTGPTSSTLDLARDHFVSEAGHDRCDEGKPILSFVCDQHAQMLCLAVAHRALSETPKSSPDTRFSGTLSARLAPGKRQALIRLQHPAGGQVSTAVVARNGRGVGSRVCR